MKLTLLRLNFFALLLLSAISFSTASYATVIKIATLAPDGTSWMKKMRAAAKEIATLTHNRVKIKYYPGGVMGDEKAILRKMRINQLQGAAVTSGTLTKFYKDANIYGMPFIFSSQGEVNYVRKHMDKLILQGLAENNVVSFGLAEAGFAYILSNSSVKSVADLHQQKTWIPDTPDARDAGKTFELNSIPLPISDVLAALQTGLINTVATSPIASIALQWHTHVKYLTDMPLIYAWATLIISKKVLNKLKNTDQKVVAEVLSRTFSDIDQQNQKDNIAALAALKNQGIQFIKPNARQYTEWKEMSIRANNRLVENGFTSKKMYQLLNKLITEYRNK